MADEQQQRPRSRQEMEAQIIAKAWADEAFMKELRSDPKDAIAKELGTELPPNLRVVIHEESRDDPTWHLVVPPAPSDELSDEELAAAAGGGEACYAVNPCITDAITRKPDGSGGPK